MRNRKAINTVAVMAFLSIGGCANYVPPGPGVPQADLWFKLSSSVEYARLTGGVCDQDERCIMNSMIKLRSTPVVGIRATEIVTKLSGRA